VTKKYTLSAENHNHRSWRTDIEPGLIVESGSTITFSCQPGSGKDITPDTSLTEAISAPFPGHVLTGPVYIRGAQPGDVLEIELLEIDHGDWGYTLVRPGADERGLLPKEFEQPYLHHWQLDGDFATFVDDIRVPIDPFPGTIGVAPDETDTKSTIPPRSVGGNLDVKYLTEGSTLLLPIEVEGAYFSIGDGHAAQGDGEVCLTAIETPLTVTAKLTVHSNRSISMPQFHSIRSSTNRIYQGGFHGTVGVAPSLLDASKIAIREMIKWLGTNHYLSLYEAYILCSVAVDLSINEIVNDPNWVVTAKIADEIFISYQS